MTEAKTCFQAVEKEAGSYPLLVERARYGLAQTYESMCELDEAREYYGKVAQASPKSVLGAAAKQREEQLAGKPAKNWYAWFKDEQPPPPPAAKPAGAGNLPKVSPDLEFLPNKSDLSKPAAEAPKPSAEAEPPTPAKPEPTPAKPEPTPAKPEPTPAKSEPTPAKSEPRRPSQNPRRPSRAHGPSGAPPAKARARAGQV